MALDLHLRTRFVLALAATSAILTGCGLGDRIDPAAVRTRPSGTMESRPVALPAVPLTTWATSAEIAKIRDEGLNRSKVMDTLDTLCNVIGPRLTSSPNGVKASNWTREQLESWGLSNAHLEEWGPFGRAWTLKRWSLQVIEPANNTLIGFPKAWSPGIEGTLESEVVWVKADTRADLDAFKGKLAGKIVLIGEPRTVAAHFEPEGKRVTDKELAEMSVDRSKEEVPKGNPDPRQMSIAERQAGNPQVEALMRRRAAEERTAATQPGAAGAPAGGQGGRRAAGTRPGRGMSSVDLFNFAAEEKAALVLTASSKGDGGTLFVQQANLPGAAAFGPGAATRPRVYSKVAAGAPYVPAQATLSIEDFNRLARSIAKGAVPRLAVELKVETSAEEMPSFNTVAEIPGTDPALKDEIVMVGAHLDSWHAASGATDNGAGSACAMEAVRIIKALGLQPRRTIRIGLWTGEEQGIFGSKEYVTKHFATAPSRGRGSTAPTQLTNVKPEHEKFQMYINLDNGTGKIRGMYCQGNEAAAPIFKEWLKPFHDLGAKTVTMRNTGGTDHLSFDAVKLPGFQFIQDSIEYDPRTHHSNIDNYDRIQADDMKQASTIMAAFLWNAAQMDAKFPRKTE